MCCFYFYIFHFAALLFLCQNVAYILQRYKEIDKLHLGFIKNTIYIREYNKKCAKEYGWLVCGLSCCSFCEMHYICLLGHLFYDVWR